MRLILALVIAATMTKTPGDVKTMIENESTGMMILNNYGQYELITTEDILLMERCVMSEAGNQPEQAQEAVATVILNRWMCPDKYPDTISGVIMQENQFSTHDNGDPTVSVRLAVHDAIHYYNTCAQDIPSQTYYFRSFCYHDFGIPYCKYGDMYFSLASDAVID